MISASDFETFVLRPVNQVLRDWSVPLKWVNETFWSEAAHEVTLYADSFDSLVLFGINRTERYRNLNTLRINRKKEPSLESIARKLLGAAAPYVQRIHPEATIETLWVSYQLATL